MTGLKCLDLFSEAEKFTQEIFDVGRQCDDQLRSLERGSGLRIVASLGEPGCENSIGRLQMIEKDSIQSHQSCAAIEILKEDAEA